jgi:hypothetical protein
MNSTEQAKIVAEEKRLRSISNNLFAVARAVAYGFTSDPGTSDLDDEQPIDVRMTLGEWRKARRLVTE